MRHSFDVSLTEDVLTLRAIAFAISLAVLAADAAWAADLASQKAALGISADTSQVQVQKLRDELIQMRDTDQEIRKVRPLDVMAMRALDKLHTVRLREIITEYGWPTKELVGRDGVFAAWLLAQHATDAELQMKILAEIEPGVERGEIPGALYALLYDRLHRPQRYGTQGVCSASGVFVSREIEVPEKVDERRAKMGVQPTSLAEYVEHMQSLCPKP